MGANSGRTGPGVTSRRIPGLNGCSSRICRRTPSKSSAVAVTASTSARQWSGTTLTNVPPLTTPTLTVTSRSASDRDSIAGIWAAISRIAEAPAPPAPPAWPEAPRASTTNL